MKKIITITLLFISSLVTNIRSNNTLISDSLRRYGVDSHIMKTRGFKKARHFNKPTAKIKNKKHEKRMRGCISSTKTNGNA